MAKNKLSDLRDHLFMQLERLNDETLDKTDMELEIKKAKSMADIGNSIINTAKTEIDFIKATKQLSTESDFFREIQPRQLPGENH